MKVILVEKSTMGGRKELETVYLDEEAALCVTEDEKEEFVDFILIEKEAESIDDNRVIIDRKVYNLDLENGEEKIKKKALSKLSEREKKVLNLIDN